MQTAEKWDGELLGGGNGAVDWQRRARRAEAEAAAAKGEAVSAMLQYEALGREYSRLVRSSSWRLTEPLRRLRARMKARRGA
jgi:hypothetical protein